MTKINVQRWAEHAVRYEAMPALTPACVVEIEIGQPLPVLQAYNTHMAGRYGRAFCVVRLHTQLLGLVEIPLAQDFLQPVDYVQRIWETLAVAIVEHLRQDGLPVPSGLEPAGLLYADTPPCIEARAQFYAQAPFVSVIVSTRDRPERIQRCLDALLNVYYPHYEIIVVDNAPSSAATSDFVHKTYGDVAHIRYVREDQPGLSSARNRGLALARGEIVAFADDDLVIDPYWLIELVRAFGSADDVVCVTGLILPLELETPAQLWFEEFGGVSKGFAPRLFNQANHASRLPLYPYAAGQFGSGASIAFTQSFLQGIGGFDPALGVGSLARAGEDLAIFFQAITAGHTIVYAPASLVYHPHYRTYKDLSKQIYGYGMGLGAYLMKIILDKPLLLLDLATKVPYGLFFLLSAHSSKNSKKSTSFPAALTTLEREGLLRGPLAYIQSRHALQVSTRTVAPAHFTPIRIAEIELSQPLPTIMALDEGTGTRYQRARCLVRLHAQPLGVIELQLGEQGATPGAYVEQLWRVFGDKINDHLRLDGLSALTGLDEPGLGSVHSPRCIKEREHFLAHAPFVSIIVATHERPAHLRKCLHSLLALHYSHYEIIVVDNTPETTRTAELVATFQQDNPHVRYKREDRQGLSRARNCGIAAAHGELLAFTDDDVVVDQYWLLELARAFHASDGVACVTGLILPLELETQPQLWFEERTYPERLHSVGFCPGFARRIFDMRTHNARMPLHPYMAGRFGAGASMAFTKNFLETISGFDPVLGSGSPTNGGEDHAAFFQAITRGYTLVYEPAAVVYHCHRRDYKDLYKQMYGYGTGFIAYLLRCLATQPALVFDLLLKLPATLFFILRQETVQKRIQAISYPKELDTVEMKGRWHGSLTYVKSLWALRRVDQDKRATRGVVVKKCL